MISRALGLTALLVASPAFADDWSIRLTPYLWGVSISTDAAIDDEDTGSSSGSNALGDLDGAFMINGEARNGRLSIIGEYNWLDLSADVDSRGSYFELETELEGYMFALGAGWAVHETPKGRLEVMGGVRYWDINYSLDLERLPDVSIDKVIIDPIVGLRGEYAVTDRILLAGEADIGGFGVGSDRQINVTARASYAFTDLISGVVGYRYLELDLDDSDPLLNLTFKGPYIALDFRF